MELERRVSFSRIPESAKYGPVPMIPLKIPLDSGTIDNRVSRLTGLALASVPALTGCQTTQLFNELGVHFGAAGWNFLASEVFFSVGVKNKIFRTMISVAAATTGAIWPGTAVIGGSFLLVTGLILKFGKRDEDRLQ
jgi:hypothetical protein